jgi:hypothetical protein
MTNTLSSCHILDRRRLRASQDLRLRPRQVQRNDVLGLSGRN